MAALKQESVHFKNHLWLMEPGDPQRRSPARAQQDVQVADGVGRSKTQGPLLAAGKECASWQTEADT